MEIISRQVAIANRLSCYFTGKICKNGHVAKRYTMSSVCAECLHPSFTSVQSTSKATARESRARRLVAKKRLVRRGFILKSDFVDTFQLLAFAASILREPSLRLEDILTARSSAGLGIDSHCIFKIFPEDEEYLRGSIPKDMPAGESEGARLYRLNMEAIHGPNWRSLPPEPIRRAKAN